MKAIFLAAAILVPRVFFAQQSDCALATNDTTSSVSDSLRTGLVVIVIGKGDQPLEGANIVIETLPPHSGALVQSQAGSTNAHGVLNVGVPASGTYVIRVRRIGYEKKCVKRTSPGAIVDTLRFTLVYAMSFLGGHPAPSIAPPDTIPTDTGRFNPVARAARLKSLKTTRLNGDERELRLWDGGWGDPQYLLRLRKQGTRVEGQLFLWWDWSESYESRAFEERTRQWVQHAYSCGPIAQTVSGPPTNRKRTFVCEARFRNHPDWSEVLRRLEENRVWTLPDASALPSDGMVTTDGWGISGEVKIGTRYRTYEYVNPRTTVSPIPGYAIKLNGVVMELVENALRHPSVRHP